MKVDRRSFIRLVPLGLAAALAGGSWWFFREAASGPMIESEATVTTTSEASQTRVATASETSQATVNTTTEASQATVTTSETSQTTVTTSEASQGTIAAFDFPVTWNGGQPIKVDTNEYRLRIDGDVSNPLELTLGELHAMLNVQKTVRIICITRWSADVPWEGIPLSYLLTQAGASLKNIDHLTVESVRGYYFTTMSSDEVANPDNMIALKAGGAPLTIEHGYPARLVAPSKLGWDWVKYVARITCKNK